MRFVGDDNDLAWEPATFSLLDEQSWTALSYCWGTRLTEGYIKLNGCHFWVRPNLYKFLIHVAAESRREWVFVDAICINQDDLQERSSQFTYMGQIYRKAVEVSMWIVIDDPDLPADIECRDLLPRMNYKEGNDSNV